MTSVLLYSSDTLQYGILSTSTEIIERTIEAESSITSSPSDSQLTIEEVLEDYPEIVEVDSSKLRNKIEQNDIMVAGYFPGWNLVNHQRIDRVMKSCERNGFNAIMVDLKNVRGELFFHPTTFLARYCNVVAKTVDGEQRVIDFEYLSKQAIKHNIRIIGRFVMFRDFKIYKELPEYRIDSDEKWLDMRNDEVVEYTLSLINEITELPIDEIVLDYIRFPDLDGLGSSLSKRHCIEEIVERVSEVTKETAVDLSIYVFGWVAWDRKQNIGQSIHSLSPYLDAIYPMLYPSHFYEGSLGYTNPSNHPYRVIEKGYNAAITGAGDTKIFPMIQVFWYSPSMVLEQIKAVYMTEMPGYGCWNATGNYKTVRAALNLLPESAPDSTPFLNDSLRIE